jgi:hypothetical protein
MNGYEYRVVGRCPRTGRAIVAPIVWNPPSWSKTNPDLPSYHTCVCCGNKNNMGVQHKREDK